MLYESTYYGCFLSLFRQFQGFLTFGESFSERFNEGLIFKYNIYIKFCQQKALDIKVEICKY